MKPVVTHISQQQSLAANGQIVQSIILTYKVGSYGPFTLVTTNAEIANGQATQKLNAVASTYAALPLQPAS